MSLKKKTISGLIWTFSQQFGIQGVGFVVSVVLARILMPEDFGLIGMITVFMAIGQTLVDSGLSQSLIRADKVSNNDLSTVFIFNLAGSVLVYVLVYLLAPLIASFYYHDLLTDVLRVYALSFIINAFSTIQFTILTKNLDFKTQLLVTIPSLIIAGIVGVILAYRGFGVWSLVYMMLVRSTLTSLQLWVRSEWKPSLIFSWPIFKHHFHFGYKLTLSGLLDTIFKNIYQIVIGRFFAPAQVGFYTRADTLKQLPISNLSTALNKVTYPIFSSIQHDDKRLKAAYKDIMQMVVFVIAPTLCLLASVADDLFVLLFTEKWLPAAPYFQIMCLAGVLYPIHSYNLNILKVKGRSDLFLRLEVIKKIMLVLILTVTIPRGITWMLWGQVLSSSLSFFINTHYSGRFIKYNAKDQFLDVFPAIFLALGCGVVSWKMNVLLHSATDLADFLILTTSLLIGGIIYIAFAFLFKFNAIKVAKVIIFRK